MVKTLAEIAEIIGGRVSGDGEKHISGVANIENAHGTDVTFADAIHTEDAAKSGAGAVILEEGTGDFPLPAIYVSDVRVAFSKLLDLFTPPLKFHPGIDKNAHIGEGIVIGENVIIMPFAVVDDHAVIGDGAMIYPHVYIGQYAEIGANSVIYPSATVREYCRIGERVIIHSGAVIGADGFGFTTKDGVHTKVPQVGNVVIGDDAEIGANVGIDRATAGSTTIGRGTKIDNLVHIGHNCHIGDNNIIVAQTGISGSTVTGNVVTFGGQCGTVGHIKIGGNSTYAARSGIIGDMPEGFIGAGFPVATHQAWLREKSATRRLPELVKRIKTLEKILKKLQQTEGE